MCIRDSYLLSMWSKESGVTFVGVALAADFLFPVEEKRFPVRRFAVYAVALGVWIALRAVALQGAVADTVFIDNPTVVASAYDRILTAAAVQLDYLRLLVWPVAQSPDYSYAEREVVTNLADPRVLGFGLVLAVALVAAARLRKRAPIVALCVAGYAVLFSVTSNFLFPIGTIEGERLAYAPSIFVLVLAAACLRPALAAAVLVVVLGGLTVRQSRIWRDEPTFFREAAQAAPKSAKARQNLGTQFEHEGDYLGAAREFEEVVRIAPRYVYAWIVLGHLRRREGDAAGAAKAWHEALELDPGFSATRADLAHAFIDLGQRAEAASQARELFGRDLLYPRLAELQNRLASGASPDELRAALAEIEAARAALARGDAKGAIAIAQELAAGPTLPAAERAQALLLLADAWESLGKAPRAGTYRKAAQQTEGRPVQESGATPSPARR